MRRTLPSKRFTHVAVFLILVGAVLFVWGLRMPIYTNAQAADAWFEQWCGSDGRPDARVGDAYFELFTSHFTLIDAGRGFVSAGLTVLVLIWFLRRTANHPQIWLRTPSVRGNFFGIGIAVLLCWCLVAERYFVILGLRRMLPYCADSIGIPMIGLAIASVIGLFLCLIAGFFISRQFGILPVSLLEWDSERRTRSWLITLLFGGAAVLLLGNAILDAFSPMWPAVCPAIIAIYLIESTRSALLAPHQRMANDEVGG